MFTLSPLSRETVSHVSNILNGSFALPFSESRHIFSLLARYESADTPMSSELITKCDAAILRSVLTGMALTVPLSSIEGWDQLMAGRSKRNDDIRLKGEDVQTISDHAIRAMKQSTETLVDKSLNSLTQKYEHCIVEDCLVSFTFFFGIYKAVFY